MPLDNDLPPSYEQAINETHTTSAPTPTPQRPFAPPPERPPPMPQRPTQHTPAHVLPWTYPQGYYCSKCGNSGYKVKNGHPCKRCWARFAHSAPNSNVRVQYADYRYNMYNSVPVSPMPMPVSMPMSQPMGSSPIVLQPGDPRIGGVLCGQCNGKGRVRFLLDKQICSVCRGTGRVF
ncbi:LAME_0H01178g1_1 [Lachancea meyersii CBS 8951]|uniref:LAME_0H01178g1_1 n=1 Tax=Lachancea meyersii CBS 8951 TaxID=1266667 RepID=A0A1G4KDF2_9SACH|nr:LAME_0H01178g1_1 [Lachancea meyersii CBS 8951]